MVGVLRRIRKGLRAVLVAVGIMKRRSIVPANEEEAVHLYLENFRALLPKLEETEKGMSPSQAVLVYKDNVTNYERKEIKYYPTIYTVGTKEGKNLLAHELEWFTEEEGTYLTKLAGDHIGYRYEIMKLLGEGSYSQVFQCMDKRCNKEVAIKFMKNNKQPLYNETLMLTKITEFDPAGESNCVRLLNYDHFRDHYYMVLESMPMDLEYFLLTNHGLGVKFYTSMLKSLLHTLVFLKAHMIVHGDLKPSNVLVDPRNPNNLKLADFGLSIIGPKKITTDVFQSRFYRAPEVFCKGVATPAMDMWSFACILAETLIGQPYFFGDSDFDQFSILIQYFGIPPAFYFEEYSCTGAFFYNNRVPTYCKELVDPATGRSDIVVHPQYTAHTPERLPPGCSDINEDFPGNNLANLRNFFQRCFVWNPKERIVPAFALLHPLFSELDV